MSSPSSQLKHFTLKAVAGAGKTRHLIQEMLSIADTHLKQNRPFPRLIATTFTRKATQEVKERIMHEAIQKKQWNLLNALFHPSQMMISTLHGILHSFLTRYEWTDTDSPQLMNSHQTHSLIRKILRNLLLENSSYFQLLKNYTFNDLCEMVFLHDLSIRQNPQLRHLSKEDILKHWEQYIHSIHPPYSKNIFEINEDDIKEWGSLIKDSSIKKNLKSAINKNHPQYVDQFMLHYQIFQNLTDQFTQKWKEQKINNNYIQIADLELIALDKIQRNPKTLELFSKEWDYWFIDEYQDINPVQKKLLNQFTKYATQTWAVGDPQQSIYLFRQADHTAFDSRVKQYGNLEEKNKNFRSTPELVSFFNDFFPQKSFPKMESAKSISQPQKKVAYFLNYSNPVHQNEIIAHRLNQILKQYPSYQPPQNAIVILVRKNEEVKSISYFLKNLNFQVQAHSSRSLKREVLDALFLLRFLIQPLDNQNLIGLLRTPYFYMTDEQISLHVKKHKYLWLTLSTENHSVVQSLKHLLQKSLEIGYSETLSLFFEKYLIIDLSYYQDSTGDHEYQLWKLLSELKEKESQPHFQHSQFVEEKIQDTIFYDVDGGSNSTTLAQPHFIQVMTIHQSKGLEFDHVIIPNIKASLTIPDTRRFYINLKENQWSFSLKTKEGESIAPLQQTTWKKKDLEAQVLEQDRLLYVATTRAKKDITFIYPKENTRGQSWFTRFPYFEKLEQHKPQNYSIHIEPFNETPKELKSLYQPTSTVEILSKYKNTAQSAQLIPVTQSHKPCSLDTILGSLKGISLHQLLYTLSYTKDKQTWVQKIQNDEYQKAIQYVLNLKNPPMEKLLNQNAEWGFHFKEKSHILKGRIDLWGQVDNHIWIVDYKSSKTISKEMWSQLEKYALVLHNLHPKHLISLCVIQPLIQNTKIIPFNKNKIFQSKVTT